jgi:heat shock protein beta
LVDLDPEEEKAQQKSLEEKFQPLLDWLKVEAKDSVRDGVFTSSTHQPHILMLF